MVEMAIVREGERKRDQGEKWLKQPCRWQEQGQAEGRRGPGEGELPRA